MRDSVYDLPPNLPKPVDDGQADHLRGHAIPELSLMATTGENVKLTEIFSKPSVLFIYPRAGSPLEPNTDPELWDTIPGARGCTPHSCKFRDLAAEFKTLGVSIYGASIQSPVVQKEFVERNHIPFPILSDSDYKLTDSLKLPTFTFDGEKLIKRIAFYIDKNKIEKVFYPIFPPDKNADEVLAWLKSK